MCVATGTLTLRAFPSVQECALGALVGAPRLCKTCACIVPSSMATRSMLACSYFDTQDEPE
eukprot:366112-Chlamydomonas_euryale.AAC.18